VSGAVSLPGKLRIPPQIRPLRAPASTQGSLPGVRRCRFQAPTPEQDGRSQSSYRSTVMKQDKSLSSGGPVHLTGSLTMSRLRGCVSPAPPPVLAFSFLEEI
jgi:hypothetical protein